MRNLSLYVIFLYVILLTGCGGPPAPIWKSFRDADAGFSAEFPGDVATPQNVDKSGTDGSHVYRFECRPKNMPLTFQVAFFEQVNTAEQIATLLKSVESRVSEPHPAYTRSETSRLPSSGVAGVEHTLVKETTDRGKSFQRYRTYCAAWGDYIVTVESVTTADAYGADVERFFNSFKIDRTQ